MIIGIMGAAGAGKDTVGALLLSRADRPMRLDSFAAPMYAALSAMLDVPEHVLRDRTRKETEIRPLCASPRRMLQTLGTEWGRDTIDADIWVLLALQRHDKAQAGAWRGEGMTTVITDVRFGNEVAAVKARGGLLVNVEREVSQVAGHVSETLDREKYADVTIQNDGSIEELKERVAHFYQQQGCRL